MSGPRMIGQGGLSAFVPNGESRRDTAIILIGTAREHKMDDAVHVRATSGGFYISDELADVLYDEGAQDESKDEPEVSGNAGTKSKAKGKKASGNRAAKNSTAEQEQA